MGVDVRSPKPLDTHPGDEIVAWAQAQLGIARDILDNPGGGLLFATQTLGQVRASEGDHDTTIQGVTAVEAISASRRSRPGA